MSIFPKCSRLSDAQTSWELFFPMFDNSLMIAETRLGILRLRRQLFAISFAILRFACAQMKFLFNSCFLIILIPKGVFKPFTVTLLSHE